MRVHIDPASAAALHARAFTAGRHIVFNAGRYQPGSREGRHLLAHELAHVAQVREEPLSGTSQPADPAEIEADRAAAHLVAGEPVRLAHGSQPNRVHRAPDSPTSTAPKPEVQIRSWLEQHQFAPPEKQPDTGERHILLNGEDMTISDAVKLGVKELGQPADLVNSVINTALAPPVAPAGASSLSYLNPPKDNSVTGMLGPRRDAFGIDPAIAKTVEFSTIDDYLTNHGFATPEVRDPTATRVLLDGKETTVDAVTDKALALLGQYPTLKRSEVLTHIRQKYVAARGGAGNQFVIGYTLVPKFAQYLGGPPDPNNPLLTQHQFSFTITRQHHAADSPGRESSFQGSVTLTSQGIANLQAGGQEAVVMPLLRGWLQISGLVQLMASANWNKSASGSVVITPALQGTVGGQILLTPTFRSGDYKFLSGHVQLGVQVLGGFQTTKESTVGIASGGLVLNIPF